MKLCYKLFQEAHPKTWQQILMKFEELEIAMNEGGRQWVTDSRSSSAWLKIIVMQYVRGK